MKTRLLIFTLFLSSIVWADTSITGLPAIGNITTTTVLPVVDTAGTPTTKKANVAQLITGLPAATSSSVGTMSAADKAKLDAATVSATGSTLVLRDSSGSFSGNVISAATVTGLASPVGPTDAVNKAYADAAAAGFVIKSPAVAATTPAIGNIGLTGSAPNTLDGVTLHLNDRILVKDQSDDTQNGIYQVATLGTGANGTWARTTDADTGAKLVTGSYVFITGGTVNVQAAWSMVTPGTIVIGTSHITWNLFSQTTQILASNIIGQIVNAQVQDGAINTAKFATSIAPVSIVSSLPSPSGYTGPKVVFNTGDSKLYRYNGTSFTAVVPTTDLSGSITTTQITDNSITTAKLQANSVTATQISAGAVVAGDIAANAVTAGTISAGAVSTTELAANAVNASKIAAGTITAGQIAANTITAGQIASGTITADRLNISSLSAISANIGTITSGTLTSSASISVGSGLGAVNISSAGLTIGSGRITMVGDGANPWIRVFNSGGVDHIEINGNSNVFIPAAIFAIDSSGLAKITLSSAGIVASSGSVLRTNSGAHFVVDSGAGILGPGDIKFVPGSGDNLNIVAGSAGSAGSQIGYLIVQVNGSTVKIPYYNP